MESRIELAHYFVELISNVYALDAQCTVFCSIAETLSDAFNDDPERALQIRKLLIEHGKGLVRSAYSLRNNSNCDEKMRDRILAIQSKIDLRNNILIEEMIKIISEYDPRPENEIEAELNDEIDKNIFEYNHSIK